MRRADQLVLGVSLLAQRVEAQYAGGHSHCVLDAFIYESLYNPPEA